MAIALVLLKALPFVPGHFTGAEFIALGSWASLGAVMWFSRRT